MPAPPGIIHLTDRATVVGVQHEIADPHALNQGGAVFAIGGDGHDVALAGFYHDLGDWFGFRHREWGVPMRGRLAPGIKYSPGQRHFR